MSLDSLKDLFLDELRDTLERGETTRESAAKMAEAATAPELRKGFEKHLKETEKQVERLKQVFESIDETPRAKTCKAMEGLVEEGSEIIEEDADRTSRAALIAAAQKVEHYEIAAYGTLATWAKLLNYKKRSVSSSRRWKKRRRPTKS